MTLSKPENKTPLEWSKEWLSRIDDVGAEASLSDVVEVIVMEAVAYERERCAKIAKEWDKEEGVSTCACGRRIAASIKKTPNA